MIVKLQQQLKDLIPFIIFQKFEDEIVLILSADKLLFGLKFLKYHIGLQYKMLTCISGVDLLQQTYRFNISYELLSLVFNSRLRVKIYCDEYFFVPSITELYINANWWEREVWDLYGIYFENHSDLRRILNDYSFEGYPMRKDFPLSGFNEFRYDDTKKLIICESIQLTQEYRLFNFHL